MKKYKKFAYIILILAFLILGVLIYNVFAQSGSEEKVMEKAVSEIKYLDNKFSDLFNKLNNITFEHYTVSSSKIKEESQEQEKSGSGQGESSSGSSGASGGQSSSSGGQSSGSSSQQQGSSGSSSQQSQKSDNKQFKLQETGILTNDSEIDWNQIKNEVENIYTFLYTTTIDLYQTTNNQEDIINFNKEYDNLTKVVKDENKDDTLTELSKLYEYLPKFIEMCSKEEKDKVIIKTKNNIFKAYSILEQEEWGTISENINSASQEFTKLVTSTENKENVNQYTVNKVYIIINELQNAVLIRDKEVFLIKYKNLLEEIKNI